MVKTRQRRSKNLTDARIKEIVNILDSWSGPLTWPFLIKAIEAQTFNRYTRQALFGHERIKNAFDLRKELASNPKLGVPKRSIELQIALDRITKLKAENQRLESENNKLLEQFSRWAYNSYSRGLDIDFLNQELPLIHRK